MGKYKRIKMPNHHRAQPNGYVEEHVVVAEKTIGRELNPGEVVHHIDKNKLNNSPRNLMVFKTESDHMMFHRGSCAYLKDDGSWSCDKANVETCKLCGKQFRLKGRHIRTNMFCSETCYKKMEV